MAISLPSGFQITNQQPVDSRFVLSFADMRAVVDARMPSVYFCMCTNDGKIYTYNSSNSVDSTTGKFRVLKDAVTYTAGTNIQISSDNVISATDTVYDDTALKAEVTQNANDIAALETAVERKQAKLTAGANIQISTENVISATDTVYDDTAVKNRLTAIENQEDTWNGKQDKLTAGTNITISDDNVISATGGGSSTLTSELVVGYAVGGISAGKTYAAGTSIETILRDLLVKDTPVGTNNIYYGTGSTIPDDVSGLTAVESTAETLTTSGYTWKNVALNNEYAFLAVDKSLGVECYEILQNGFALGFVTKDLGSQILYYPDSTATDTGIRFVYHFEEA